MRVFIAEDQFLLRHGLENLLSSNGIEVAGSADTAERLAEMVDESAASLALLDIRMPPTHTDEGLRAAMELRTRRPGFTVVLLSQYVERLYVNELLADNAGGVGYLLKDRVFEEQQFVDALRAVHDGGTVIDPEVVTALMRRSRVQKSLDRLTPRETEVLAWMAEGETNSRIAARLVITEKAVAKHINSMFAKLDLPDSGSNTRRVQAVLTFLQS